MDECHLRLTIVYTLLRWSTLGRFVRSRFLMSNLWRAVLSRSFQHPPESLAPGVRCLYLPLYAPLAPLVVICDTGNFCQRGRWQAMDAHRDCRNNALSSL